ncbi:uncharacterized protein LOC18447777 [Amborella trichopoda]|uniref:Uncharacterized protein n=1 Tax=Amborella trichopoda TaxID=13333 RepID=U5DG39_AMBTC|nr:uncharacterized protein LOC18447777 [Amborella trichopoda]ERN19393.1 hypothetical protein AMTR_s00069p00149060 [Amborella trichopoda]|eukprot:XP_006857926.1 uncharacterized protein LOC18447777 [Amborella trichopoda]
MLCKSPLTAIPSPFFPTQKKHGNYTTKFFSLYDQDSEKPISTITENPSKKEGTIKVEFQTLGDSKLGISRYPNFDYNAEGGTGRGKGRKSSDGSSNELMVSFDIGSLYIPPLNYGTTRFLGLPLPPFLKIDIVPEKFDGIINEGTGKVDLEFRAKFCFSAGSLYRPPALMVETILTTEEAKGVIKNGKGERMDDKGKCRLVGVATVDPIHDFLMNAFLGLPTECIADLNAQIFVTS